MQVAMVMTKLRPLECLSYDTEPETLHPNATDVFLP